MWGDCKDTREHHYLKNSSVVFIKMIQIAAACGEKEVCFKSIPAEKATVLESHLQERGYTVISTEVPYTNKITLTVSGWYEDTHETLLNEEAGQGLACDDDDDIPF